MPFAKNSELPKGVRDNLPEAAQNIWRGAFNGSFNSTCKGDDSCASKIAWSAVEKKYKKENGKWVARADLVENFSLIITKAAYDKPSGEMRFSATASDTGFDSYEQRMSLELFRDFIRRATTNIPAPVEFQSSFWKGGMPYMSVSHYPDLEGKAVPGVVQSLYIDGDRLKAKGILYDNPLGRACWRSICESLYADPPIPEDEKVRISIAFLDWKHAHGNLIYDRKSLADQCPACREGTGDKIFLEGQLIHLAFTRVPVNQRTDVEVELSMSIKTQKEDAASIVGDELAAEIDETQRALVSQSEAVVIRADTEEEAPAEEVAEEEAPEVEEEAAARKDVTPADKKRATKEYGNVTYADETNKKYPIDTPEHIRAAWSYIHMPRNRSKYSSEEVSAIEGKIAAAWRKKISKEGPPAVKKSMIPMVEENGMGMDTPTSVYYPYEGAISFEEAQAYMDESQKLNEFMNEWGMFQSLAMNILSCGDVPDKHKAMKDLVKEFQGRLDESLAGKVKKLSEFIEKSQPAKAEPHPLDEAVEQLKAEFDTASKADGSKEEKLQLVQQSFATLGEVIKMKIPDNQPEVTPVQVTSSGLDVTSLKSAFAEVMQPFMQTLQLQNEAIRQLQQTGAGQATVDLSRQQIPQRRSLNPSLVRQSELAMPQAKSETPKLRAIINKSVGLE